VKLIFCLRIEFGIPKTQWCQRFTNWRYFEMYDDNVINNWFGGGQDLTPYYLFEEDAFI
jgi:coproporphyrinogen III oxidase